MTGGASMLPCQRVRGVQGPEDQEYPDPFEQSTTEPPNWLVKYGTCMLATTSQVHTGVGLGAFYISSHKSLKEPRGWSRYKEEESEAQACSALIPCLLLRSLAAVTSSSLSSLPISFSWDLGTCSPQPATSSTVLGLVQSDWHLSGHSLDQWIQHQLGLASSCTCTILHPLLSPRKNHSMSPQMFLHMVVWKTLLQWTKR